MPPLRNKENTVNGTTVLRGQEKLEKSFGLMERVSLLLPPQSKGKAIRVEVLKVEKKLEKRFGLTEDLIVCLPPVSTKC